MPVQAGASKQTVWQQISSPRGRILAIALVPTAYVLGFLLWAYHAHEQGLGFLPLTSPRYLMAGALLLIYVFMAFFAPIWALKQQSRKDRRRPFVHVVLVVLANLLAIMVFTGLGSSLHIFVLKETTTWGIAALPLLAILVAGIVLLLFLLVKGMINFISAVWNYAASKGKTWTFERPTTWEFIPMFRLTWAFALFFLCAIIFLPAMESEYGGAKPRHAEIVFEPLKFTPKLAAMLGATGNETTRSSELTVFYYDGNVLLVRPASADEKWRPLYEIDRSTVSAIIWID